LSNSEPDLFGPKLVWDADKNEEKLESAGAGNGVRGDAGHFLTVGDLMRRGFSAAYMGDNDADVVANNICGKFRRFQVKASGNFKFGENDAAPSVKSRTGSRVGCRSLTSYKGKIDAFAFVDLNTGRVYYESIDAVSTPTVTLSHTCFSLDSCNRSFDGLIKRWTK
jgi:hypothetical protein